MTDTGTPQASMPFWEHIRELRSRIIRSLIAVFVGFSACYYFSEQIFRFMVTPLAKALPPGSSMIFTGITEAFITYMKVSFVAGILLASPYIFWQFWSFVAPALYKNERKLIFWAAIFSSLLFIGGAAFGYFVAFPAGFNFLLKNYSNDMIKSMPSMKESLGFAIKFLLGFGIIFELPLITLILARFGLVTAAMLIRYFRYAIVGIFIVAAVISPGPDVISQLIMVGPMLLLYGISIVVAKVFAKGKIASV